MYWGWTMLPGMELMGCPKLAVPLDVMQHVVRVESSFNPYAIGVVGGRLQRQPRTLPEALATVRMLVSRGFNFSLGLAQVNRYNLGAYGLDSYEKAFQVCPNLQAGSRILAECLQRSGRDWGKAFSCYYSGNFVTGFRHGYVQKVFASMGRGTVPSIDEPASATDVVERPGRAVRAVTRFPTHSTLPTLQRRVVAAQSNSASADTAARNDTGHTSPHAGIGPSDMPSTATEFVAVLDASGKPPALVSAGKPATSGRPTATPTRDKAFVF